MTNDLRRPQIGERFETEDGSEEYEIRSVEEKHEQSVTKDMGLGITTNQHRFFVLDQFDQRWAVEWDGDRWEGRRSPRRV